MRYMSERQYESNMREITQKNRQIEMRKKLRAEKTKHYPQFKFPSTSKLVLFVVIALCLQIVGFCEFIMYKTSDTSAMYALIGLPVTLVPVIWGYYSKSKAENTEGGIVYEMAVRNNNAAG